MKLKIVLFLLLNLSGTGLAQTGNSEVVMLVYHRFGDNRYPSTNISLPTFEAQLGYLKSSGFESATFDEALNYIKAKKNDRKLVVISIDDGYSSFYTNGWPLLKKYGFTATLFINTSTVGSADYMDWKELAEVQKAGIEIGNHSHSHPFFLNEPEAKVKKNFKEEVETAQKLIQSNLGFKPTTFAYPYGEWTEDMASVLKDLGFKGAAAQNSGVIYADTDLFHCPRFPMSETYGSLKQFKSKVNMHALEVEQVKIESTGFNGSKERPKIEMTFQEGNLNLNALQCFVQGSTCSKSIQVLKEGITKLSVKPKTNLSARRTLFTITVPDKKGNWHWFSYLWLLPENK